MNLAMTTSFKRKTAAICGVTLASALTVLPMTGAQAEPVGCTSADAGSTSSVGLLKSVATGHCAGNLSSTIRAEIKQDIGGQPDPLVAGNSVLHYGTNYSATVTSCDNGKTATYYGRGFFTTDSTYHDSPHTTQHTCS